jgi:outer membrane protein assembly factor BamE (lipoprotein component of BamABCDE complex)
MNKMKKAVLLVILAAGVLTSCSTYTCPTYAKAPQQQGVRSNN